MEILLLTWALNLAQAESKPVPTENSVQSENAELTAIRETIAVPVSNSLFRRTFGSDRPLVCEPVPPCRPKFSPFVSVASVLPSLAMNKPKCGFFTDGAPSVIARANEFISNKIVAAFVCSNTSGIRVGVNFLLRLDDCLRLRVIAKFFFCNNEYPFYFDSSSRDIMVYRKKASVDAEVSGVPKLGNTNRQILVTPLENGHKTNHAHDNVLMIANELERAMFHVLCCQSKAAVSPCCYP